MRRRRQLRKLPIGGKKIPFDSLPEETRKQKIENMKPILEKALKDSNVIKGLVEQVEQAIGRQLRFTPVPKSRSDTAPAKKPKKKTEVPT